MKFKVGDKVFIKKYIPLAMEIENGDAEKNAEKYLHLIGKILAIGNDEKLPYKVEFCKRDSFEFSPKELKNPTKKDIEKYEQKLVEEAI